MEANSQFLKRIASLPKIDYLITRGCNVDYPFVPCDEQIDWGLVDPTGKDDAIFRSNQPN